jgi:hypothetical protein
MGSSALRLDIIGFRFIGCILKVVSVAGLPCFVLK